MKLLLDQNLPISLKTRLCDIFPHMLHVRDVQMERSNDRDIWEFAKVENTAIITKDSDFLGMSLAFGFPPKVILLKTGNRDNDAAEQIIRDCQAEIQEFLADAIESIFIVDA